MATVVGQVTPVARHSDEFSRLEHLLQLSCRSTAVKDINAWSISNPHLNVQFERRSQGLLAVDCWVDITTLDPSTPVQEVCKRGFAMPESGEGVVFNTGNIAFDMDGPESHQYLMCTVAVGRSYVQDDPSAKRELPAGYDSLYLHLPTAAGGSSSGGSGDGAGGVGGDLSSAEGYRHTYVVFDSAQVLPRYVVHFGYSPRERLHREPVKPINLADIKARVAEALSLLGPAAPAATEKMLSDIGDAYESAIASSQAGDALLEDRKRGIREMLGAIDDKLQAVQANSAAVEEALYSKLQEALFQLQEETHRKMNLLLSEELELRRQLQQIDWSESFVRVMQDSLPPMTFIAAWERHCTLRSQLYAQLAGGAASRVLDEVHPDMRLVGHIEVMTERAAASAAAVSLLTNGTVGRAGVAGGYPALPAPVAAGLAATTALPPAALTLTPATMGAGASGGDTMALWQNILRQNMGLAPAPTPAPAPVMEASGLVGMPRSSAASGTTSPVTTVEAAQALLANAKSNLATVEAQASRLPPHMKGAGDVALADAHSRIAEAEGVYAAKVREEALAMLPKSTSTSGPRSATTSPVISSPAIPTPTVTVAPAPPARAAMATPTPAAAHAPPSSVSRTLTMDDRLARYSLKKEAERKHRSRGLEDVAVLAFPDSRILSPADAQALYMCLPFGVTGTADGGSALVPSATRLLWATYLGGTTVTSLAASYATSGNREPTITVIKVGDRVFGGFAADPWDFTNLYGGSAGSFLFSIDRDARIPYTGRVRGPAQDSDRQLALEMQAAYEADLENYLNLESQMRDANNGVAPYDEHGRLIVVFEGEDGSQQRQVMAKPRPRPFVRCDALKSSSDTVQFGLTDLVLRGDLSECSSELESSYGVGLRPGSVEAKTFLAGATTFRPDMVEVWTLSVDPSSGYTALSAGPTPAAGMGAGGAGGRA